MDGTGASRGGRGGFWARAPEGGRGFSSGRSLCPRIRSLADLDSEALRGTGLAVVEEGTLHGLLLLRGALALARADQLSSTSASLRNTSFSGEPSALSWLLPGEDDQPTTEESGPPWTALLAKEEASNTAGGPRAAKGVSCTMWVESK